MIGIPIIDSSTNEAFSLQEAIVFAFSKSDNLLIMIGAICSALVRRSNTYIFFDSHSHGKDALSNADGKAVMKIFPLLDDVIAFLYAFYNSANIELTSQFEVLPVSLQQIMHRFLDGESEERQRTSRPNLIGTDKITKNTTNSGNFLNFQPTNTTKHTDRQSYMRQYMQKRRQDAKFRQKERKTEVLGKRTAREDPEYRDKERKTERIGKRTAREDPEYRDKERKTERIGKRTARENPEYHNKELIGKRTAREDPEYRDKERKTERIGKRTARENPEYHNKELIGKRTAREDPEYRDKERKTELLRKRTARENPEYHNKELLGKRTAREDPVYRDKERKQGSLSRKKRRECLEYREKERQLELRLKRLARSYPRFKLKERLKGLKSKQRLRRNKYFLELERLKKQHARKCSRDKERISDKKRKSSNRANFFYKAREQDSAMKRKYGSTVEKCIELFHSSTSTGPIYVCSCCHQTWFSESMTKVERLTSNVSFQSGILTGVKSVQDKEWICRTCLSNIKKNKVPKLSVLNGMKWPNKPAQLNLHPLEERLISLRIPFMQIRELPKGRQYCVKGNVINVPVEIQPTVNALPRQMDENFTIPVKLKKKLSYKKCDFTRKCETNSCIVCIALVDVRK